MSLLRQSWMLLYQGVTMQRAYFEFILITPDNEKWTISDNDSCGFIFDIEKMQVS